MRVATSRFVGGLGHDRLAIFADIMPQFVGIPMKVIGRLFDDPVRVWVKVFSVHAAKTSSWNNVPQMSDNRINKKQLSVFVPIHAPWIRRADAHDFELVSRWMEPPDATVDWLPFVGRRTGYTDVGDSHDAIASVKPTVRSPAKAVHDGVSSGAVVPAIQHDDGFTVGHVVFIRIGNEQQVGRV